MHLHCAKQDMKILRLMEIQHQKKQSYDTIETGCPVLDSVHLCTLAVVTEVILELVNWSRTYSLPYNLGRMLKVLLVFD